MWEVIWLAFPKILDHCLHFTSSLESIFGVGYRLQIRYAHIISINDILNITSRGITVYTVHCTINSSLRMRTCRCVWVNVRHTSASVTSRVVINHLTSMWLLITFKPLKFKRTAIFIFILFYFLSRRELWIHISLLSPIHWFYSQSGINRRAWPGSILFHKTFI